MSGKEPKEPSQTPTPDQTPSKPSKRPSAPQRNDSEMSTSEADDPVDTTRSRSQSRRRRRQNQRQRQTTAKAEAGGKKADAMASIGEADQDEEDADDDEAQQQQVAKAQAQSQQQPQQQQEQSQYLPKEQWLNNPHPTEITGEMQPFDRIKKASESMNGPVTYARALRGEIPWRGGGQGPSQPLETAQSYDAKSGGAAGKDMMDYDGLKLKLELNLDIEIEIKASIHGDLTLALL